MNRFFATCLALTTGLLLLAHPALAQKKNTAPAKPVKPVKKAPTGSTVVLGTTQLPGDFGKLGTTYTVGKGEPINFTLKSAEYTTTPLVVGNNTWVPTAKQKLLVLHYTVHNPLPREQRCEWGTIGFTAVDAEDKNQEMIQAVVREGTTSSLDMVLKPAQKVECIAAILVPAEGVVPKLIVEREKGAPVVRYDLRGKVTPLPASIADAADTTGATARKEVPATPGTFYATGVFDTRLDSVAYTTDAIHGNKPEAGQRYITAVFTLKNRTNSPQSYYWGTFNATLVDADGEKGDYTETLLKATRDEKVDATLAPGEETRVRFYFPISEKVDGKALRFSELKMVQQNEARVFAFDVSGGDSVTK